ncbi:MAG: Thioredoxin protein, partial [Acidimicrobiaceae bacterium]|nr:Thioredoxin protein [Acidimicrobiaceae bacterium]
PGGRELRAQALGRFAELFDPVNGGFRGAPKFPQAPGLELVLRAAVAGSPDALAMVETTLEAMAAGGIYDHLEGGFARYSVDGEWQVPHFEKMLYDQASLARLYLHAFQVTGDERWRQVVEETVGYVLSALAAPDGGFCSSEDADAGGVEGRFPTWTPSELVEVLGPGRAALAAAAYGVDETGNFEEGRTVLHRPRGQVLRDPELEAIRADLTKARDRRERPARDDKVLTEWNAMFCSVLAEAALALERPDWRDAAVEAAQFLLEHSRGADGRWRRAYAQGRSEHLAVAADYAWLVDCFTRLGECTGEARWSAQAEQAAEGLMALFSAEDGGWYTTGIDAEPLVVRPRDTYDGVVPAAGSVAAVALARLGALAGRADLTERAESTVKSAGEILRTSALALPHLVLAAELLEEGPLEVVVVGERNDLVRVAASRYLPTAVLAWGEPTGPLFAERSAGLAYVCRAGTCLVPDAEPDALVASLAAAGAWR